MTEVGGAGHIGFLESTGDDRCATWGFPLPGWEQKVIDPATGEVVPLGTVGELCVRGYGLMQGYYKKPEETAEATDSLGRWRGGDMATLREDGTRRFLGRYKDLLKVGGENVGPAEVEEFLLGYPAVDKAQVVGVPDPLLSEVVCACVVVKPDQLVNNQDLETF